MARRGRPFSDNPRKTQVAIRFTDDEYKRLEELSKQSGSTMADVVRDSLAAYGLSKRRGK